MALAGGTQPYNNLQPYLTLNFCIALQGASLRAASAADVALRRMAPGDRAFLLELYGSVREAELAHVPWDESARHAFIEQQFAAQDAP